MKKYRIREGSPIWWAKYIGALVIALTSLYTMVILFALISY